MAEQVESLVEKCTVRLKVLRGKGTGFFVAPGLVLTCAHVVEPAKGDLEKIKAIYNNKVYQVTHIESRNCYYPKQNYSYPDLALLTVDLKDHPCVFLDSKVTFRGDLYIYGYTGNYLGGAGRTVKYDAPARFNDRQWLLLVSHGQITPGLSGSPLLDVTTGGVCGIVKKTRDRLSDLGGGGVPTKVILDEFPELQELQKEYHNESSPWLEACKELGWGRWKTVHIKPAQVSRLHKNREEELSKFREYVKDPQQKMICIVGDAGVGKTHILCKICEEIENRKLEPPLPKTAEKGGLNGIIYYDCRRYTVGLERLLGDVETLLGDENAGEIRKFKGNPEMSAEEKSSRVLDELTKGAYFLVLDNLEGWLTEEQTIKDVGLSIFIDNCLSTGDLRILASSREEFYPAQFTAISNIQLDKGLPSDEAVALLRELDRTGKLRIRNAPKGLLDRTVAACSGIPRALELVIGYLSVKKTKSGIKKVKTLEDLLNDKELFGKEVVEKLAKLLYSEFTDDERMVLQALAIYNEKVPARAISFLLKPFAPEIDVEAVLGGLEDAKSVYWYPDEDLYYLHPVDQAQADLNIPTKDGGFNRKAGHAQAGKYWFSEAEELELKYASPNSAEPYEFTDLEIRKEWVDCVERGFQHLVEGEAWAIFRANNERMIRALEHRDGWGDIQETTAKCKKVRELIPKIHDPVVSAKWLRSYTIFNIHRGNFAEAEEICREGLLIAKTIPEKKKQRSVEGELLWRMAWACWGLGRIDEARECIAKSAQLKKEESEFAESRVRGWWSELDEMEGQLERALEKQKFALLLGSPESKYHRAQNDERLLRTYRLRGNYDSASKYLDDGLKCARKNDYTRLLILILCEAGDLSINLESCEEASKFLFESYSTADDRGYKFETALSGYALGRLYHLQGHLNDARVKYEKTLSLGMALLSYKCAVMLGLLSLEERRFEDAEEYLKQGIDCCNKLLENNIKTYDPLYYRSLAQLALEKEEALDSYKESLAVCSAAGVLKEKILDLSLLERANKSIARLDDVKEVLNAAD